MDLQDQLEIGKQAEEFLRYISERPYFNEMIDRIKVAYAHQILALPPEDRDGFFTLKTRMDALDEVLNMVRGEVYLGQEALKEIDGVKEQGIL